MNKQEQFFYDNAGFSVKLGETEAQGRERSAKEYALAETWAVQNGYSFCDEQDTYADESFMEDESEEYKAEWSGKAWVMLMYDEAGAVVQSCGGCFGDSKYKRVMRAELALEQMSDTTVATA